MPTAVDFAMRSSVPSVDHQEVDPNQLPPELEAMAEKLYGEINVRPFFAQLAVQQENLLNGKIHTKTEELQKLRDRLNTITQFLDKATDQLKNTNAKEINLADDSALIEKLHEIFPHKLTKQSKWTRQETEWLCNVFTRKSEKEITPEIHQISVDMTHLISDWEKIIPQLKDLLKAYDDLINRINNKPH